MSAAPQAPGTEDRAQIADITMSRVELMWTLVLDTLTVLVALGCRAGSLKVYAMLVGKEAVPLHIHLLELVLNYGVVLTALAFIVFDFAKRVRRSWRRFRTGDDAR